MQFFGQQQHDICLLFEHQNDIPAHQNVSVTLNPYAAGDQFGQCKMMQKITETLANGYSSESTQPELSKEYQHDRVWMVFKNLCLLVLWMGVASALEGLKMIGYYAFSMSEYMLIVVLNLTLYR